MNATYREDNCIELCLIQLTNNKYNWSLKSYYDLNYLKNCRDDSDFSNDLAGCEQECPTECDTNIYSLVPTVEEVFRNKTSFVFMLGDFSSLEITQIPKFTSFNLVSTIGGTLGLFVGIRFLSIVEVVELFMDILVVTFSNTFFDFTIY